MVVEAVRWGIHGAENEWEAAQNILVALYHRLGIRLGGWDEKVWIALLYRKLQEETTDEELQAKEIAGEIWRGCVGKRRCGA